MKKSVLFFIILTICTNLYAKTKEKTQNEIIKKTVKELQTMANDALNDEYLNDEFIDHMDDKGFLYNSETNTFYFDKNENSPLTTILLKDAFRIKIGKNCFVDNFASRKLLARSIKKQIPEVAKFLLSYHKRMFGTQTSVISRLHTVKLCSNNHDQDVAFETGTLYINNGKFALTGRIGQRTSLNDRYLFFHWNRGNLLPVDSGLKGLTWMAVNPISYARTALRYYAIQYAKKLNIDLSKTINKIGESVSVEVNGHGNEIEEKIYKRKLISMLEGFDSSFNATIEKKSLSEILNIYKRAKNLINNTEFITNMAEAQAQANVKALANRRRKTEVKQRYALVNHSNFHDIRVRLNLFERYKGFVVIEEEFESKIEQMFALVNTYSVDIIDISVNLSEKALGAAAVRDAIEELGYNKE